MKFMNVVISPICDNERSCFRDMFATYFREDLKIDISDDQADEICSDIIHKALEGVTSLDIMSVDGEAAGFIFYQIDSPDSDWCERPGWGFIREIFIKYKLRGMGLGSDFVTHTEQKLYHKGAERIYLTSDESGTFWTICGYVQSEDVSRINHCPIYEKYVERYC